jgi:hypothetical protein
LKVYLSIGANNRVQGWGNTRGGESDVEIDVADNHGVLKNPFIYTYSGGVLAKDTAYQEELKNRPKPLSQVEQLQKEQAELVFQLMDKGVL